MSSRSENVARNSIVGLLMKLVNLLLTFIVRTVFISVLGKEYLGINGLFTNILTILSFAELGIGNAIVFSMYKPLAQKDYAKVNALMKFYHKCYCIIGIVIITAGLIITPFIPYLISGYTLKLNIYFLFILYLINTAVSYFFSSRTSFLSASQQQYKVDIYQQVIKALKEIAMGIVLVLTHDFILYLLTNIILEALFSLFIYIWIGKENSFLKEKSTVKLTKDELSSIGKNVFALILYKVATTVLSGTDNIIISAYIGLEAVGILSNYTLIVTNVTNFTNIIGHSITASIGNLNAGDDIKKQEKVFNSLLLVTFWIFGLISIGMLLFFNPVLKIWLGSSYLFSWPIVLAVSLNFYVGGLQTAGYTFRITKGYFRQSKYFPVLNVIINIGLSILLVKQCGVFGVLIATPISRIITTTLVDPYYVYKLGFKKSPFVFYKKYVLLFLLEAGTFVVNYIILRSIPEYNVILIAVKMLICVLITNLMFYVFLHKDENFIYVKNSVKSLLEKNVNKFIRRNK
ncbi:MAG: oligosaccharide flippase family protein [Acutalibacteraceae bacterium]|nr:oligosaccharide flippase family protein [Acutalibacteraceae bacterium]